MQVSLSHTRCHDPWISLFHINFPLFEFHHYSLFSLHTLTLTHTRTLTLTNTQRNLHVCFLITAKSFIPLKSWISLSSPLKSLDCFHFYETNRSPGIEIDFGGTSTFSSSVSTSLKIDPAQLFHQNLNVGQALESAEAKIHNWLTLLAPLRFFAHVQFHDHLESP